MSSTTWPSVDNPCNGAPGNLHSVCNFHGSCGDRQCICLPNYSGIFCDQCSSNTTGYPGCNQPVCVDATTCSGHGTCLPPIIPCKLTGCDPATTKCYVYQNAGRCLPLAATGCGTSTCTRGTFGYPTGNFAADSTCAGIIETGVSTGVGVCCPTGQTGCQRKDATGKIVSITCCNPKETCCDGVCCSSTTVCKSNPEPPGGWPAGTQPTKYCSAVYLTNVSVIRIVILPLSLTFCLFVIFVAIARTMEKKMIAVPALLITFFCIFVIYSANWPYALLLVLTSFFSAASTKAKIQHKYSYVLLAQIVVFAILLGGLSFGVLFVNSNDWAFPILGSTAAVGTASVANTVNLQTRCAQYFNYFWREPNARRSWDADLASGNDYWGYCDLMWLSALQFFHVAIVVFFFVMIIGTIAAYADDDTVSRPPGKTNVEMGGTSNDQL